MRRFLVMIFAVALLAFGSQQESYAQLSNLHFTAYKINRILPKSFRSCYGEASVTVRNDSLAFAMTNVQGIVYKNGVAFVSGQAGDMSVPVGTSVVPVTGLATLCEGITLWNVLGCIPFHASEYTIDIEMDVTNSKGETKHFAEQQMSVAAILSNLRGKKNKATTTE